MSCVTVRRPGVGIQPEASTRDGMFANVTSNLTGGKALAVTYSDTQVRVTVE